jgi:hypothetical protein
MVKIIDNIVPISFQNKLESIIGAGSFDWYFQEDQTYATRSAGSSGFQFTHTFWLKEQGFQRSAHLDLVTSIVYMFEDKTGVAVRELLRAKANLLVNNKLTDNQIDENIHIDGRDEVASTCMSLIYYVSDSDGDTIIWDKGRENEPTRVTPKRGRLIYFPSNLFHRPSQPVNFDRRMVINFVVEVKHGN